MTPDYYATLGLSPASEDVVIHAAYRALIRRYHPDGNASAAAAARARAINAAYAVLSDPAKRADYDEIRAAEAWPKSRPRRSILPAPSRMFAAASVTVLLALVVMVIWLPPTLIEPPDRAANIAARAPEVAQDVPVLPAAEESTIPDAAQPQVANPQLDEPPTAPPPQAAPRIRVDAPARAIQPQATQSTSVQLAKLDRQQALLFNQSWAHADAAKRAQLLSSRDRFVALRDGCRSNECTRSAYLARMREVSAIMIGPPKRPN
ncbi:MAG: DnaJ domain-containing protein [Sphingomicrobium sp.]